MDERQKLEAEVSTRLSYVYYESIKRKLQLSYRRLLITGSVALRFAISFYQSRRNIFVKNASIRQADIKKSEIFFSKKM